MAKQIGAVRYIGRLGNTVGYKARDGKGDAFDANRIHVTEVSNPQTLAQMTQRMKLTPVQNFYRGLAGLLDHSWQGVKYGNPSRLQFYSQAMKKLSAVGVPYVPKGERQFVPWEFPISSGSLTALLIPVVDGQTDGFFGVENLMGDVPSTIGQLSSRLLSFLGVEEGMQITFIWILQTDNGGFAPTWARMIVDSADNTPIEDSELLVSSVQIGGNTLLAFQRRDENERYNKVVVGAGIICSKLVGNTWQRGNASLVVADSIKTTYGSQAAFNEMLTSYKKGKSADSDWYLNEGGDISVNNGPVSEVTASVLGSNRTFAVVRSGSERYVPVNNSGSNLVGYRRVNENTITATDGAVLAAVENNQELTEALEALGYTRTTTTALANLVPGLLVV